MKLPPVRPRDREVAERVLELDSEDPVRRFLEGFPAIASELRRVEAERFVARHAGDYETRRELVAAAARRVERSERTVWRWLLTPSPCDGSGGVMG